jgi:hypothetical protein
MQLLSYTSVEILQNWWEMYMLWRYGGCCSESSCFMSVICMLEGIKKLYPFHVCVCVYIFWKMLLEGVVLLLCVFCVLSLIFSSILNLSTLMVFVCEVQKLV